MFDVIVVGAGPGGSAAAYYLSRQGMRVLLLDKAGFPRDKTCGDGLTPRAVALLDEMGILAQVTSKAYTIRGMQVVSPSGAMTAVEIPSKNGLPDYALVVPRLFLDNLIRERALEAGAAFRGGVRVANLSHDGKIVRVTGESDGSTVQFQGRAAILATGANMKLLRNLGVLQSAPDLILAARTYFEGLPDLEKQMHFRFDHIPLPGYGWIFPLPGGGANVGVGHWPARKTVIRSSPQAALRAFVQSEALRPLFNQARQAGPVKGFPIRTDFLTARTFGDGYLVVGEAAGLVNPLTGEGIDYALESARMAAGFLAKRFSNGDFTQPGLAGYDDRLRAHFQPLFLFSQKVRRICMSPTCLNLLTRLANRRSDLKMILTNILLGSQALPEKITAEMILRVILGRGKG